MYDETNYILISTIVGGGIFALIAVLAVLLRRVVPTNEVHIVQSSKRTTSYGKDTENGNTYYEWPSWVPVIGINRIDLPVSVFDLDLAGYEAYDKGRLPFVVDVKAFFRISDSNMAAQRVSNFEELHSQLKAVVQGAVRTILASNEIEDIMQGRSKFGDEFTREVSSQLSQWGVSTVKNIELMDIRDGKDSHVIQNIMAKKKSHIEMESRTEVAKNMQAAKVAETNANREVELNTQDAAQATGLRTAQTRQAVSIAVEKAAQATNEEKKLTKQKDMAIIEVERVRQAEIERSVAVTEADQKKQSMILAADGQLESKKREAEAIQLEGGARAAAETAMKMAPVQAQTALAKEIGTNVGYQNYLVTIRKVEADQAIGVEQAKALKEADIKVIANSGDVGSGIQKVSDLFSSRGGTSIAAMLEAFVQSEAGKAIVEKITT